MSQIFLSDGTTTVYFANDGAKGRFGYTEFVPKVPQAKGGGTWQESPVADGRRLLALYYDNVVDVIKFNLRGLPADTDQDDAQADMNELLSLVRQANTHWTSAMGNGQVYIGHKAKGETNTRYALVRFAEIPELGDLNSIEWEQLYMLDLTLIVEHGHWQDQVPGGDTAIAISSGEDYDSIAHGWQTPTSSEIVHVANHRRVANITHIFRFDDSAGTYSADLSESTAFDLFPAVDANDALRICSSSAVTDAGGVTNLVFDIGTAASGGSFSYQYYDGSTWQSMTVVDVVGSSALTATGIVSVALKPSGNTWNTGTFNSVTGYWIQLVIVQAMSTVPAQQNRIITSAVMNGVQVAANQIGGTLPAGFTFDLTGGGFNRVLVARRKNARGTGFTPWINLRATGNDQNQSGITVAVGGGAFAQEDTTEWERSIVGASIGTDSTDATSASFAHVATVTIASTVAQDFSGYFRLSLTGRATAQPTGTLYARVRVAVAGDMRSYIAPLPVDFTNLGDEAYLWTIGTVGIDTSSFVASTTNGIKIYVDATHENGVGLHFYSMSIMPVDEWTAEVALPLDQVLADITTPDSTIDTVENDYKLTATSVLDQTRGVATAEVYNASDVMIQRATVRAASVGAYEPATLQDFYFLFWKAVIDADSVETYNVYNCERTSMVTMSAVNRYLGSRGAV